MSPKIVDRDAFKVMGVIGHFASAAEDHTPLWEQDFMLFHDQIKSLSVGEGYYGVYLGADHAKPLDILAGMVVPSAAGAPAGVQVRELPAATYAVFECLFREIGLTYGYIWDEWLRTSAYGQDASKLGFDYYPPATTDGSSPMEIWLPVKKGG
ncbi:MAG: GyrI-like domain-containing protein [Anaerolineae bacterium]|nr:GyrI-like domain-containing protein [Anaerolineae bacterium]